MNNFQEKFTKEGFTMPLGSLLNAYGQINQGKGIKAEELIKETKLLEEYAKEIVQVYQENEEQPF